MIKYGRRNLTTTSIEQMINQDGNKVFNEVDSAEQLLGYRYVALKLLSLIEIFLFS
jgi:hypothetical protein